MKQNAITVETRKHLKLPTQACKTAKNSGDWGGRSVKAIRRRHCGCCSETASKECFLEARRQHLHYLFTIREWCPIVGCRSSPESSLVPKSIGSRAKWLAAKSYLQKPISSCAQVEELRVHTVNFCSCLSPFSRSEYIPVLTDSFAWTKYGPCENLTYILLLWTLRMQPSQHGHFLNRQEERPAAEK